MQPHRLPFQRRRSSATTFCSAAASSSAAMFPDSATSATASVAQFLRRTLTVALFFVALGLSCFILYRAADSNRLLPRFSIGRSSSPSAVSNFLASLVNDSSPGGEEYALEKILKDAAMDDKTIILTTLNEAWAAPNSIIDLFLESFRVGERTRRLLNHLVIITLDQKAFERCLLVHTHCFALVTEGVDFSHDAFFMTPEYLKMMWRRIDFLRSVLEMGYNFIFTDADIMWFRDPFPRFYLDADFQIACDQFIGNSDDVQNRPNGGFNYVKSNNRSIEFYKFWYSSREQHPGYHDQDVLNFIKFDPLITEIGLKMKFLDTAYFGGLCEPSKDLNLVCTMHANCCVGLDRKVSDLKQMLQDWKQYMSLPRSLKRSSTSSWNVPRKCSLDP